MSRASRKNSRVGTVDAAAAFVGRTELVNLADPANVAAFVNDTAAKVVLGGYVGQLMDTGNPPVVNRAVDPQLKTTGASASAPSYPLTRITTGLPAGFSYGLETTRAASPANGTISQMFLAPGASGQANALRIPVTPGELISASASMWTDQSSARARLDFIFYDSSGVIVGSIVTGTYSNIAPSTWETRSQINATVPATAAYVTPQSTIAVVSGGGNAATSAKGRVTGLMVVTGSSVPGYGDGAFAGWSWLGTAHASQSQQAASLWQPVDSTQTLRGVVTRVVSLEGGSGSSGGSLTLTRAGSALTIAQSLGGSTLSQAFDLAGSLNGAANIGATSYAGVAVASGTDEVTPIRTQMGTVGANHGHTCVRSFTNPDGKTTADLGSVWTDGTREYVLLAISGGLLIVGGSYTTSSGVVSSADVTPTVNLTHVSGATHTGAIVYTTAATTQLYPSIGRSTVRVSVDGVRVTSDGTYKGGAVTIRETYDVLDYADLYDKAKANVGISYATLDVAGAVRVTNIFRYLPSGVCRITTSLDELKPTTLGRCGAVQAFVLDGTVTRYLPGVGTAGGVDWTAGVNMGTYAATTLITTSDLVSATRPPAFALDVASTVAFVMGYLPFGARGDEESTNAKRITGAPTALWDMRSTKKSYPTVVNSKAAGWGRVTAESYRAFLTTADATTVLASKSDAIAAYDTLATLTGIAN